MTNILDYVKWRGDLPFSRDPMNPVDTLVFSALSYIRYMGAESASFTLRDAAQTVFAQPEPLSHARVKQDLELLELAADSVRFGMSRLCLYREKFSTQLETQFAAMTFLLDDGSMVLAFRGTDSTLVGWKEDFNMTFQQTIPAQLLAAEYTRMAAAEIDRPMHLMGHSKGGNLAVFAAARSSPMVQSRILDVWNHDGPGFTKYLMGDPGYLAMVPKISTYIPQSSVIGMLLEHEEPYTIIRSREVSILQHELYTWEVMGRSFIHMENTTVDSRFLDATIKTWFASMTNQERNQLVDVMYALLASGKVEKSNDIFQLKNLRTYVKTISSDESLRKLLSTEFQGLIEAAKHARGQFQQKQELPEGKEEK
ncbi:MAG: DUF2974 domain-containing protein [Eubacteriales bacterium]|nr:DUF2974 domain-containing protein [Eubacteriales bacterium]